MEEALEILWTYARREPLDSNGETIVPTINNSIAAIRIIMRLEGWAMESEKRKIKPSENLELGYVGEKRATPAYATSDKPASHRRGKVRESGVCEQFALIMIVRVIIRVVLGEFCLGELPFAPTITRWLIMRCQLFTINFSLFTSHRPSFQSHNDTDSGNTIVDGRDNRLSIAIQRLTTSVCPKYI